MTDSFCVRVHQHGANAKKGLCRSLHGTFACGLAVKIHVLVDTDGLLVRLELTAGQSADAPMAEKLLSDIQPGTTMFADKAGDTDVIRNFATQRNAGQTSPPRPAANSPSVSAVGSIASVIS